MSILHTEGAEDGTEKSLEAGWLAVGLGGIFHFGDQLKNALMRNMAAKSKRVVGGG